MAKKQQKPTPNLQSVAARVLADKIARDLMTDAYNGRIADRLVLERNGKVGAGWGFPSLVKRINKHLTGEL